MRVCCIWRVCHCSRFPVVHLGWSSKASYDERSVAYGADVICSRLLPKSVHLGWFEKASYDKTEWLRNCVPRGLLCAGFVSTIAGSEEVNGCIGGHSRIRGSERVYRGS